MADDQPNSPSPEELAQLLERYNAVTQGIAAPIAQTSQAPLPPGAGVLAPQPPQVPSAPVVQSEADKEEEAKDDDLTEKGYVSSPIEPSDKTSDKEDSSDDSDDSEDDDSSSDQAATPAPASSNLSPLAALLASSQNSPNVQDQYKDAIKQRNLRQLFAGLSQAGNMIGSGLAGQHGAVVKTLPQDYFDAEMKQANQPVSDLKEKMALQGDDPNSEVSKAAQAYAAKLGINLPNAISANTLFKILPIQEKFMASQESNATRRDTAKYRSDAIAAQREATAAARDKKDSDKATDQQNKALTSAQQLLESARGNPAAAQAEKDLYSAQKADSLATMYGDPNKLSLPQVKLLASEVGKIAAGGVSSQSELEGITPNSLTGRLSQYVSNLTNNPTPANAAAFVKQYTDYTKALAKDAKKVIQDKYGRVIEARKSQLGDDNYQALKDQYLNRFNTDDKDSDKKPSGFDANDPKDIAALQTVMKNNPDLSQQDAINALVAHKKDQGL